MAHPAFDNDERCRDPQTEGATIVSIFKLPNARPKQTLATPPAALQAEPPEAQRAAAGR